MGSIVSVARWMKYPCTHTGVEEPGSLDFLQAVILTHGHSRQNQ